MIMFYPYFYKKNMRKEIILSGMTSAPYDDQAPDGQTSLLSGVEIHNNAVRMTQINGTNYDVSDNDLIFVHVTSNNKTIFILKGTDGYIKWKDRDSDNAIQNIYNPGEDIEIQAVNNTLVFLSKNSPIRYALWTSDSYKYLGELPDLKIKFGLISTVKNRLTYTGTISRNEHNQILMTDINSILNGFASEHEDFFIYPFYARAAIRLYDGSIIKHSSPILIFPNSEGAPTIFINNYEIGSDPLTVSIFGFYSSLTCTIINDFSDWSDVIQSVDIFVSEQFNNVPEYNAGEYQTIAIKDKNDDKNFSLSILKFSTGESEDSYDINYIKDWAIDGSKSYNPDFENEYVITNLYLLSSIKIEDIITNKNIIVNPKKDVLKNIVQQEQMEDDYKSHDIIFCENSFVYNKRLVISNVKRKIYGSPSLEYLIPFSSNPIGLYTTYLKISKGNSTYYINCGSSFINQNQSLYAFRFIFVPEQRAKQIIFKQIGSSKAYVFDLEIHPFLYGSYYYRENFGIPDMVDFEDPECVDIFDEYPNTIYTSETSNPYIFPVEGVLSVGNGNIIALASLTKELSPSQFGQYPLVALCSDGNYALKVTSEGLYTEPSLMQSEICSNKNTVTQLKSSIVFASKRGLMLMDGSDIICISEVLNGPHDNFIDTTLNITDTFISYLENAKISYDYYQDRILVINPDKDYIYIYNLTSASWSVYKTSEMYNAINSYPFSYIQYKSKAILMLDSVYEFKDNQSINGVIVTRPLKLDTFLYKRINTFSIEGSYISNITPNLIVEIYGSNDNQTWYMLGNTNLNVKLKKVGRIRGRFFKFYRFIIKPRMSYTNHITGIIIDFDEKTDSRLR